MKRKAGEHARYFINNYVNVWGLPSTDIANKGLQLSLGPLEGTQVAASPVIAPSRHTSGTDEWEGFEAQEESKMYGFACRSVFL